MPRHRFSVSNMDPLSDVLALLKPRSYMCGGFDLGGAWSIRFARHEGVKCYALVSGQALLSVDGVPDPVPLTSGDCFLLPHGRSFSLSNDLSLPPVDVQNVFPMPLNGGIVTLNGGGNCLGVGGHIAFSSKHAGILLGVLPPIVHIRNPADKEAMRWSLDRMRRELREPQPGSLLVAQQLAYMLLVQALRLHLAEGAKGRVGWLFALADEQMSRAISAMHDNPGYDWTLQELAVRAGMSRSSFALKFKQTVGKSAMEYLTRWRMALAADRLTTSADSISAIAQSLGYDSESAFSTAFKRIMGSSPRQYTRIQNPSPASRYPSPSARPEPVAG